MKNSRNHDNAHAIQAAGPRVQYQGPNMPHVSPIPKPQPPDSEIQSFLKAQEGDISSLQSAIDRLRDRLGPILIPCPESAGTCAGSLSAAGSEVGAVLRTHTERIESCIVQINNLSNQLAI